MNFKLFFKSNTFWILKTSKFIAVYTVYIPIVYLRFLNRNVTWRKCRFRTLNAVVMYRINEKETEQVPRNFIHAHAKG